MFWAKKNEIHLTRGDSAKFRVNLINKDGTAYTMDVEDRLVFSIRNEQMVVYNEVFNSPEIELFPSDTASLTCQPYRYEIELHTGTGEVYTVIGWELFVLEREVF